MDDLISRKWLMECVNEGWIEFDTQEDENRFVHLIRDIAPPAQPTLYGYDIKHLAFVASIMAKKGVSPEEAVTIFRDVNRVIEMMLEDMKEMQENELKQALKKPWEGEKHGTHRAVLSQKPVR